MFAKLGTQIIFRVEFQEVICYCRGFCFLQGYASLSKSASKINTRRRINCELSPLTGASMTVSMTPSATFLTFPTLTNLIAEADYGTLQHGRDNLRKISNKQETGPNVVVCDLCFVDTES